MSDEKVIVEADKLVPKTKTKSKSGEKVYVGCMMHHGLNLNLDNKSILLNGQNTVESLVISRFARGYTGEPGITILDSAIWEALSKKYAKFYPFTSGLVFAAKNAADLQAKAKEMQAVKTGAEQRELVEDKVEGYVEGK